MINLVLVLIIAALVIGVVVYVINTPAQRSSSTYKRSGSAYKARDIDEGKRLTIQVRDLKRDAIERYEHDINSLIRDVSQAIESSRNKTKQKFESRLSELDLTGFNKFALEEKIESFNQNKLQPIFNSEASSIQRKMAKLGDKFYRVENQLDADLESVLNKLRSSCGSLNVPAPDINLFRVQRKDRLAKMLEAAAKNGNTYVVGGIVSAVCLLGFSQSAAAETLSDTTTHGTGHMMTHGTGHMMTHGTGHMMTHGTGHIMSHGTGHVIGHGAGHTLGHVIGGFVPVLNIALLGFSLFKIGRFLFDDSEVKDKIRSHTRSEIDKYYSDMNSEIINQLHQIKDDFRQQKERLFNQCAQLTIEALAERLESA